MNGIMKPRTPASADDLKRIIGEIHAMLARGGIGTQCVVCQASSWTVLDIQIAHDDFLLTVPLTVCRRCAVRPPFPPTLFSWRWCRQIARSVRGALGGRSKGVPADLPPAPTLQSLIDKVPQYQLLTSAFPEFTLSCVSDSGPRYTGLFPEAKRFLRTAQLRRDCSYLIDNAELNRAGLPALVLAAFGELVDAKIRQSIDPVAAKKPCIVQVGVALLPDRQWRFDIQILGAKRREPFVRQLRESLESLPTWPVSYPVVFAVRRVFADPPDELFQEVRRPFDEWSARTQFSGPTSYSEAACRAYDITLPRGPIILDSADCLPLLRCLPENLPLRILHADMLQMQGRREEELAIYEALLEESPEDANLVYRRILCLAGAGHLERAAFECQRRIEQFPQEAAAYALLADFQCRLDCPAEGLKTIDKAIAQQEAADSFRLRGTILAQLGRFSEAMSAANTAIFQDRDCGAAYMLRAKLLLHEQRREEALADLKEFDRCGGKSLESLELQSATLLAEGRVSDAEQAWRTATEEAPHNLDLRVHWAEFLAQTGKLESAKQECDQVVSTADHFALAYATRAAIALAMNQFEESIHDADEAIKLGADGPRTFLVRGVAKASKGDVENGLKDLEICIDKAPEDALARFHRGRMHFALDDYVPAAAEFSAALKIAPDWSEARVQRGYALLAQEEHEEARKDFEQALQESPQSAQAYTGRAITHLAAGNKAAASEDLNKALALDPSNLRGRLHRAMLLLEDAETELAKEDLNEILAAEPHFEPALWQRAHVHLQLGRFSEAKHDFDRLIEINPEQPQSLIGRSVAHELSGEIDKAEADREEARRLAPLSADQLTLSQTLLLASVASSNEQFDKAVELATKVIEEQPDPPCEAYRIRGHARWYSEEFVEALEDYSQIIEHGDEATRHDFSAFGQLLGELGEFERGLEALDRSIEIAREQQDRVGLAFSLNGRGRALSGLGRLGEAEEAFTESLQLKPDNAWLHYYRGLMYLEQEKQTHALACFELSLRMDSPRLPPGKRRRAAGFAKKIRSSSEGAANTPGG
jgi:tetratricopeptide (TPR) repeat protein